MNTSKGKLSREELRKQLSEQIPTAIPLAAKALGVLPEQLDALLDKGIQAKDFLPKFAKAIRENVRESGALGAATKTVGAGWQRLKSAGMELIDEVFKALDPEGKGTNAFFENLIQSLKNTKPYLIQVGKVFGTVIKAVGYLVRGLSIVFGFLGKIGRIIGKQFDEIMEKRKAEEERRREWLKGSFLAPSRSKWERAKAAAATTSKATSTVNSGNTLNVNISGVDPSNQAAVRETMDSWWSDTMAISY